ncbi:MAG: hypothetical protein AB7S55_00440 [Thiomonas sp.]
MNPAQIPADESQLVAALTEVLRQQRHALVNSGSEGAPPITPIWQPLIDALDAYTARRQAGDPSLQRSPELVAEVSALRDETMALQHTLSVWSAALQQAIAQSRQQTPEPTYGPAGGAARGYRGSARQVLGKG